MNPPRHQVYGKVPASKRGERRYFFFPFFIFMARHYVMSPRFCALYATRTRVLCAGETHDVQAVDTRYRRNEEREREREREGETHV